MILALIIGSAFGFYMAKTYIDMMLILYFHRGLKQARQYEELFDRLDGEFSFDMSENNSDSYLNYADFLYVHQETKNSAFELFEIYRSVLVKTLIRNYALLLVLPAVLFWDRWWLYVIFFTIPHIAYLYIRLVIKGNTKTFYTLVVAHTLMNEYATKELKRKNV